MKKKTLLDRVKELERRVDLQWRVLSGMTQAISERNRENSFVLMGDEQDDGNGAYERRDK